jgi:hypothetical protein
MCKSPTFQAGSRSLRPGRGSIGKRLSTGDWRSATGGRRNKRCRRFYHQGSAGYVIHESAARWPPLIAKPMAVGSERLKSARFLHQEQFDFKPICNLQTANCKLLLNLDFRINVDSVVKNLKMLSRAQRGISTEGGIPNILNMLRFLATLGMTSGDLSRAYQC